MISFKQYLIEYAMGEKTLSKAVTTNAKVGFEFEICLPLDNAKSETIDIKDIKYFDEIDTYFDPSTSSESKRINDAFGSWIDKQREKFIDENFMDYVRDGEDADDEKVIEQARFNASYTFDRSEKNKYDMDDYAKDEYGSKKRGGHIDWYSFINDLNLVPLWGWEDETAGILYISDPSDIDMDYATADVAHNFSKQMGIDKKDIDSSGGYHLVKRTGSNWIVETDSTISPKSGDVGVEIVSPPMNISDAIKIFKNVINVLNEMNAYTNSSTGLHINISLPGKPEIDFLKLVLLMGEENELKKYGRELNNNAKSHIKSIIEASKKFMSMIEKDIDIKDIKDIIHSFSMRMVNGKYASFNFEKYTTDGYIEFRIAGGDYLSKDINDLIKTIQKFTIALSLASNKEEAKKDYYKKVYKLLQDVIHKEAKDPHINLTGKDYLRLFNYPMLTSVAKKIPDGIKKFEILLDYISGGTQAETPFYNFIALIYKFMKNAKINPDLKFINDIKKLMKDGDIDQDIWTFNSNTEIKKFFKL